SDPAPRAISWRRATTPCCRSASRRIARVASTPLNTAAPSASRRPRPDPPELHQLSADMVREADAARVGGWARATAPGWARGAWWGPGTLAARVGRADRADFVARVAPNRAAP